MDVVSYTMGLYYIVIMLISIIKASDYNKHNFANTLHQMAQINTSIFWDSQKHKMYL